MTYVGVGYLVKSHKDGGKMLFMATDMANAIIIFSKHISPLMVEEAFAIPIYSINIGTPLRR